MPRDLEKINKEDLLAELDEKHGITVSEEHRDVELPFEDVPRDIAMVDLLPEGEPAPAPEELVTISEPIPLAERTQDEIIEEFTNLLDHDTEEEREEFARQLAERENAEAEIAQAEFAQVQERVERDLYVEATVITLSLLRPGDQLDAAKRLYDEDRITDEELEVVTARLLDGNPDA